VHQVGNQYIDNSQCCKHLKGKRMLAL